VIWGQQSFDEMMVCMFNVAFDSKISTRQMLAPERSKSRHDDATNVGAGGLRGHKHPCGTCIDKSRDRTAAHGGRGQ
jgi:hypothetical protein